MNNIKPKKLSHLSAGSLVSFILLVSGSFLIVHWSNIAVLVGMFLLMWGNNLSVITFIEKLYFFNNKRPET